MKKSFLLLFIALSGCAVNLKTTYDHQKDFNSYQTFCWMNGCEFTVTGPDYLSDEKLRASVKQSIINELEKKGMRYDENNPDLVIDFHITLVEESAIIHHRDEDEPFYYKPMDEMETINYLNGTLVIDMADRKEGRMVWRSVVNGYMDTHPELTEENLGKGIRQALKHFPPRPKPSR